MKQIPFSVFVLAPFPGSRAGDRGPTAIGPLDRHDIDRGIEALDISIDVVVPQTVCHRGEIDIHVSTLRALARDRLTQCSDYLSKLTDALAFVRNHRDDAEATGDGLMARFGDLPLDLRSLTSHDTPAPSSKQSALDALFSKVAMPGEIESGRPIELDAQIEKLIDTVTTCIHEDKEVKQLSAILRGMEMLLEQGPIEKSENTTLYLCPVNRDNMEEALRGIVRSSGDHPPSLVLVDLSFDNTFSNIDAIETLANFSSAVNAPTIINIAPGFFGLDTWDELSKLGYLSHEIQSQPYAKFRTVQASPGAAWLTATMPLFATGTSAGWVVSTLAAQSIGKFGWPSRLTDDASCRVSVPTESQTNRSSSLEHRFSHDRIAELHEIGMAPIRYISGNSELAMNRAPTLAGGTLGHQLLINRIIAFFFEQRERIHDQPTLRDADDLIRHLEQTLLTRWRETDQPEPEDLLIGIAKRNQAGPITLSIRMTPPKAVTPEPRLFEFELEFDI